MLGDAQVSDQLAAMLAAIDVPAPPTSNIILRASTFPAPSSRRALISRNAVAAAIAAALALAALPIVAPGFAQSLEARIAALLQWTPPPSPPKAVKSAMVSRHVTLEEAQRLVGYRIVPPAGLPHDAAETSIVATPAAVYSKTTHAWRVGAPSLTFSYRRADGREFGLLVDAYDPRTGPPPRYMFNADERTPDGLPKRYWNFAWRNAGQITSAVADENLTRREIEAIRAAMHGAELPYATTRDELNAGTVVKMYAAP
jgi:hypothetical protein